jgi:cytidine deaminase
MTPAPKTRPSMRQSTPVRQARLNADLAALKQAALEALEHAYAPYSGFKVGAALLGEDWTVVAGCNVENASYPAGICAERGALSSAIARGLRTFELMVVATEALSPTPPCGICRQMLSELAPGLTIVSITTNGEEQRWQLTELLPSPFNPHSLDHA